MEHNGRSKGGSTVTDSPFKVLSDAVYAFYLIHLVGAQFNVPVRMRLSQQLV